MPTEFAKLVEKTIDSPVIKSDIEQLVAAKRSGQELDSGPRIDAISDYIERELARLDGIKFGSEYIKPAGPIDDFNRVFRNALDEVW